MRKIMKNPTFIRCHKRLAKGVILLESMVAAFLLAVGLFGVLKMISNSTNNVTDSEYRHIATARIMEMIEHVRVNVDRKGADGEEIRKSVRESLQKFAYNSKTESECKFSGGGKMAVVEEWVARIIGGDPKKPDPNDPRRANALPGAEDAGIQIAFNPDSNANPYNMLTVTVCWQTPKEKAKRVQKITAYIN